MKELSIEEKARRYDRSIEKARDVYTYYCDDREQLRKIESIFPELKESDDERIRKALIRLFQSNDTEQFGEFTNKQFVAWLEKQGEQKPAWSEEDKEVIISLISYLENELGTSSNDEDKMLFARQIEILKSLRPQNRYVYNPYKAVVECIANMCSQYGSFGDTSANDFINNIRVKCKDAKEYDSLYPQAQWKPSDEQIEALESATENCAYSEYQDCLKELVEQLKKLKG